jgi:Mn-dependent DtxR family transcriptional regulator
MLSTINKGGEQMVEKTYLKVDEVAELLGVSKSYAYKIVQKLNAELDAKGFLTISGRVNKKYFLEKACYGGREEEM